MRGPRDQCRHCGAPRALSENAGDVMVILWDLMVILWDLMVILWDLMVILWDLMGFNGDVMVISWGIDENLMMGECMGINNGFHGDEILVVFIGGLYDFTVFNNLGCLTCLNHTSGNLTCGNWKITISSINSPFINGPFSIAMAALLHYQLG